MGSRVNYAAVGVFVLVLGALLIGAGLWLGADIQTREYDRYGVFFSESVAGLNRGSSVKYRGVRVGQVSDIGLDKDNPQRVRVLLEIYEGTPIKTDTVARLDVQGLTGVASIELEGGSPEAPPLADASAREYPIIETVPSLMVRLDQALTQGLATLDQLADRFNNLLSEGNVERLTRTLEDVEQVTSAFAERRAALMETLENARTVSRNTAQASAELPELMEDLERTLARFEQVGGRFAEASEALETFAEAGGGTMRQVSRQTLPQLNLLLEEMRSLSRNLDELSQELADNPEMLIYGRPRGEAGPGEE